MKKPKFAIKTLGCKVNQYEGQVLRENLLRFGFQESWPHEADLFILNSCTVTEQADIKTRKVVRKVKRENPATKIFVTGCYAVLKEDIQKLRTLPEVYMVVPGRDKSKLPLILASFFCSGGRNKQVKENISGFASHTRAFIKIQDGCNQNCSYCKVNLIRGPSRCREERDILAEVTRLVRTGYREIVMTGICLGAWKGRRGQHVSDLLKDINGLEGDFRIRISSVEPNYIDESLIEVMASSRKICRHLHIPLQSGSNRILKLMNRKYTAEEFNTLVEKIRKTMPFAGITMDVIVGFPGESEADFEQTEQFLQRVKPSRLHVFQYSDRKGTPSFRLNNKLPRYITKNRAARLIRLGNGLRMEFCDKFVGKVVEVLVEQRFRGAWLTGYTGEYLRVKLAGFEGYEGRLVRTKVNGIDRSQPCLLAKNTKI